MIFDRKLHGSHPSLPDGYAESFSIDLQNDKKTADKAKELNNNIRYTDDKINKITEDIHSLEHTFCPWQTRHSHQWTCLDGNL